MEVLHDLRPRCGAVVRQLAALVLSVAIAACGDGDREGLTADSAVMQRPGTSADSTGAATVAGDSAIRDSATADSLGLQNPTLVLAADSASGDVLFRRKGKCLSCHGLDGKGIDALGPNLQDTVWLHGDGSFAFIQRTIIQGIARPKVASIGMPAFGSAQGADLPALSTALTPQEIYHISAYVYTLSHPASAVADTTPVVTDLPALRDSLLPPVPPPPGRETGVEGHTPLAGR